MILQRLRALSVAAGSLALTISLTAPPALARGDCSTTSTGLVPLTELGSDTYQGEQGGLYPGGSNLIPLDHLNLGLARARAVVPRDRDGTPDDSGVVVMISIGVSNTMAEFNAFRRLVAESDDTADDLVLVNGAQIGRALGQWALRSNDAPWSQVDENLAEAGVAPAQVQVAWIMLPTRERGPATLTEARENLSRFVTVLQTAKTRYPNLELAYVSSRIYGGYIDDQNSEPNAYNHGFEMKWLIETQLTGSPELNADLAAGPVLAPWIDWGPYLWADGTTPRSDGLVWLCSELADDGVHPGEGASSKVAAALKAHFSSDPTATPWFLNSESNASVVTRADQSTNTPVRPRDVEPSPKRPDDRAGNIRTAPAQLQPDPWPTRTFVGVGLAGLILGATAASAVRRQLRTPNDGTHAS